MLATLAIAPAAVADTFDWTYGGAGDPVYAYGTLIATPDASIACGVSPVVVHAASGSRGPSVLR